jgi:AraC family transcriptional regulator, melibiose operon regulatory protein
MQRFHQHQELELNFVFSGALTYLHHGARRSLEAGRLALFWGAVPHSVVAVAPRTDMAWVTLPLAMVRGWGLGTAFMRDVLAGEWHVAPAGTGGRFPVAHWVEEFALGGEVAARRLEWELRGCLGWLAQRTEKKKSERGRQGKGDQAAAGSGPVEAMAQVMAARYQEPLDVAEVAAAAGLHPNYAMALFRRQGGMTIHAYLTRLRVMHAQRRLLEGEMKVADVALECGFGTVSSFYAAFTAQLGVTPTAFRTRGKGA